MAEFLKFSNGQFNDSGIGLEIPFTGANDILFPFDGTLIVSPQVTGAFEFEEKGVYKWLFQSFLEPTIRKVENNDDKKFFMPLKNFSGRTASFEMKTVLLFIANESMTGEDVFSLDLMQISSSPGVIAITLDNVSIYESIPPITKVAGTSIKDAIKSRTSLLELYNQLEHMGVDGKITAYDFAGMQIDAYSALACRGFNSIETPLEKLIQLVDLHGTPVFQEDVLEERIFTAIPGVEKLYQIPSNAGNHLCMKFKDDKDSFSSAWPFGLLSENYDERLYLISTANGENPIPRFLRICVFTPYDEFQNTEGGKLTDNIFERSGFSLYTKDNYVRVFNNGKPYMKDFYEKVSELKGNDQMFLCNWKSNPHLNLTGTLDLYDIPVCDKDTKQVKEEFEKYTEAVNGKLEGYAIAVRIEEEKEIENGDKKEKIIIVNYDNYYYFPLKNNIFSGCMELNGYDCYVTEDKPVFMRLNKPFDNKNEAVLLWKSSRELVKTIDVDIGRLDAGLKRDGLYAEAIKDWFILGVNGLDPHTGVLKRQKPLSEMITELGGGVLQGLKLFLLNIKSGVGRIYEIAGNEGEEFELPPMTAKDTLAVAIVTKDTKNEGIPEKKNFLTYFCEFKYADESIRNAMVPYHQKEFGGLLRGSIKKGVNVRAMYWDDLLSRIEDEEESGEGTNVAITSCINNPFNGERGGAVIDCSYRALGSFHQKSGVLIKNSGVKKEITAYVGGIDLTTGRWDTDRHYSKDPDRQSSTWHDVHVSIQGEGGVDVFKNFQQRWNAVSDIKTLSIGIGAPRMFNDLIDAKIGLSSVADPKSPEQGANAFVQINRTVPPETIHSNLKDTFVDKKGELGANASYIKAIRNAKKFIHIEDQYLFDYEIAMELHEALKKIDGPDFLVLVLPENLGENPYIDGMLFARRYVASQILRYGAIKLGHDCGSGVCPRYQARTEENNDVDVTEKIVACTPINSKGEAVYVHSKHMIVDDVWMTIGSSNIGYRSMTYDFEIDAAMVGNAIAKGGTEVVKTQRMELWRLLLGIPDYMSTILDDPYAGFKLFKAIEASEANIPVKNILPFKKTMVRKLDFSKNPVAEIAGTTAYFDTESIEFCFVTSSFIDPDGRVMPENNALYDLAKYQSYRYVKAEVSFNADPEIDCTQELLGYLEQGDAIVVRTTIHEEGKNEIQNYSSFEIKKSANNELVSSPAFVIVPFDKKTTISLKLYRKPADASEMELMCGAYIEVEDNSMDVMVYKNISIAKLLA